MGEDSTLDCRCGVLADTGSLGLEAPSIPCPLPRLQLEWLGAWLSGNGYRAKLHFDQVEGGRPSGWLDVLSVILTQLQRQGTAMEFFM